jgi:hypothetical protein
MHAYVREERASEQNQCSSSTDRETKQSDKVYDKEYDKLTRTNDCAKCERKRTVNPRCERHERRDDGLLSSNHCVNALSHHLHDLSRWVQTIPVKVVVGV